MAQGANETEGGHLDNENSEILPFMNSSPNYIKHNLLVAHLMLNIFQGRIASFLNNKVLFTFAKYRTILVLYL